MKEFKVGDKVRVKEPCSIAGAEGEILKVDGDFALIGVRVFEENIKHPINLKYLEHIEPKRKFKRGDDIMLLMPKDGLKGIKPTDRLNVIDHNSEGGYISFTVSSDPWCTHICPDSCAILRSEWEEQQKPKVGDEVYVKCKIHQIDKEALISNACKYLVTEGPNGFWVSNVLKRSDIKD